MIGFFAFVIPLAFYFSKPSCFWNFDGVACATAIELGSRAFLFHADHLLYGFFGYLFWHLLGLPLGFSRALPALQLFTSLLSAAGLIGLYKILVKQSARPALALLVACTWALTPVFWVWSIEAQVYALGFLGLAWATYVLLYGKGPLHLIGVGLLHGFAVLGHVLHGLWLAPAFYWIWNSQKSKRAGALARYVTTFAATVAFPYTLVIVFALLPNDRSFHDIVVWLKGSAGLTPDRHWSWHTAGWSGPLQWLRASLCVVWGNFWPYRPETSAHHGLFVIMALSAIALGFILGCACLAARESKLRTFCWIWLAAYGVFLWTWEPSTLCYRMTDIIPLALLCQMGLQPLRSNALRYALAGGLLAALGFLTWTYQVEPMSHSEYNTAYTQTMQLARATPDRSLYLTRGGTPWIYLLYFTGRTAWSTENVSYEKFLSLADHSRQTMRVYFAGDLLSDPRLQPFLTNHPLKQVTPDLPWFEWQ